MLCDTEFSTAEQEIHTESNTRALPTAQYGKPHNAGWFKRN